MGTNMKTILIVDDDPDQLFQLKTKIENLGYKTETAESQLEAEKKMEEMKPDLSIFDLMLENEDSGFILSYKSKKKYPEVPVIIASAVTAETGFSFGLESEYQKNWINADLYLDKNIRQDQLQREINKLLKI